MEGKEELPTSTSQEELGGPHGGYGPPENTQLFRLCRELNSDSSVVRYGNYADGFLVSFPRVVEFCSFEEAVGI
jgi:hypothetical protein